MPGRRGNGLSTNMRRGQGFGRRGRPRGERRLRFVSDVNYFKPRGVPMTDLGEVVLLREEVEALQLKNIKEFDQNKCAEQMKVSQSTFQRILSSAYKKVSQGIVQGKAIKIED